MDLDDQTVRAFGPRLRLHRWQRVWECFGESVGALSSAWLCERSEPLARIGLVTALGWWGVDLGVEPLGIAATSVRTPLSAI